MNRTANCSTAASTMYEQAWRISMEQSDAAAVRRRHTCLVSAVSCLLLVDPENHWIVHPSSSQETYDKVKCDARLFCVHRCEGCVAVKLILTFSRSAPHRVLFFGEDIRFERYYCASKI